MYSLSAFFPQRLRRSLLVALLGACLAEPVVAPAVAQPSASGNLISSTAAPTGDVAFRQPAFPGGPAELSKFLSRNLQYPPQAAEARASGRVLVSFWVDEQGQAYGFGALQSPHPALAEEALRVARKIPQWEPGLQEGRPATMQMYLPVTFKLMDQ